MPVSEIDEGIGTKARGSQGTLEEAERAHILATLRETRWVLSGRWERPGAWASTAALSSSG